MNNKCESVPCGARILGRSGTVGCMRASLPGGQDPHSWMGASVPRSTTDQQHEHPDVPLIWSDQVLSPIYTSVFNPQNRNNCDWSV